MGLEMMRKGQMAVSRNAKIKKAISKANGRLNFNLAFNDISQSGPLKGAFSNFTELSNLDQIEK
jgi:hypothetical protein